MRNFLKQIIAAVLCSLAFLSCSKDHTDRKNEMSFNKQNYDLIDGVVQNYGDMSLLLFTTEGVIITYDDDNDLDLEGKGIIFYIALDNNDFRFAEGEYNYDGSVGPGKFGVFTVDFDNQEMDFINLFEAKSGTIDILKAEIVSETETQIEKDVKIKIEIKDKDGKILKLYYKGLMKLHKETIH